jgi:quinol-cytochrome oxidoreductase complex cytochrome b subunit
VPLVDRKADTDPRRRKAMIVAMFLLISIFIGLMIAGAVTPIAGHL